MLADICAPAVQQWQILLAINYPARVFGISRQTSAVEARKLCPEIQLVHVATYADGDTEYKYHDKADVKSHKVSLAPYRIESGKINDIFRRFASKCGA